MNEVVEITYWHDKELRRQLLSPSDDLNQFYMNLGILFDKLTSASLLELPHKCICIKIKKSKL